MSAGVPAPPHQSAGTDGDRHADHEAKEGGTPARGGRGGTRTPPLSLEEAFVAAGAQSVLQKLWYDDGSALADTVRGAVPAAAADASRHQALLKPRP